jgi:hypothetical protein
MSIVKTKGILVSYTKYSKSNQDDLQALIF